MDKLYKESMDYIVAVKLKMVIIYELILIIIHMCPHTFKLKCSTTQEPFVVANNMYDVFNKGWYTLCQIRANAIHRIHVPGYGILDMNSLLSHFYHSRHLQCHVYMKLINW